jgi:thioesterase domain-containing protein
VPDRLGERGITNGTSLRSPRREKDEKSAVFLFLGLDGGDVWEFAPLLSMAEGPLHFVPIRYRHWSELRQEPVELDRLIADCVGQIESYGPPPAIHLVGYSFGGQMAWAVAGAMASSGHRIGLLGLIDAPVYPEIQGSAVSVAGRLGRLVRGIRRGKTVHQLARSTAGILFRSRTGWMRDAFRRLHGFGILPRILDHVDEHVQMRYHIIILRECIARLTNSKEQFHYPAVLFRCAERPPGEDADLGWLRHLANLCLVTLLGNHDSVLRAENVEKITEQLTAMITEGTTNFA